MRKREIFFGATKSVVAGLVVGVCLASVLSGCETLKIEEEKKGKIVLNVGSVESCLVDGVFLKSGNFNLDTNTFILSVYSSEGEKVYDGLYGQKPKEFVVKSGGYDVSIYSHKFSAPKFSTPVLGDSKTIMVNDGEQAEVTFNCKQTNAGIRLQFTDEFKKQFSGSGLNIVQGGSKLLYEYTQTKFAYVLPGSVDFTYTKNGKDTLLLQKNVEAAQMLTMQLTYNVTSGPSSKFTISIDTARVWSNAKYNLGLKIPDEAYTIAEAKNHIGEKNVMVFGYIYGGDASSSSVKLLPPFTSKSSLVIAPSMEEKDRANCFVVELPSGKVRDGLNLVDNPDLLGMPVVVTGTIVETYYGNPGIKETKGFTLL